MDNKEYIKKEVVNGVTILYKDYKTSDDKILNNFYYLKSIEIYDENGNEFYANYEDINEAYSQVYYLANNGISAIVGPLAPTKDYANGCLSFNYNSDGVGVYLVKTHEKNKKLVIKK